MNKDEIKKALECCQDERVGACGDCPYNEKCEPQLYNDALDLIVKQEKEIERLTQVAQEAQKEAYEACQRQFIEKMKQAKIEVLTKLKEKFGMYYPHAIDEMIEELKK